MRALIVGAGSMGRSWGKNLKEHPEVDIAGWVDIRPEVAESAADELELTGVRTGDDLAKALSELKPDFLVDVTVPEAHHDVTILALRAGVPVLGEKPMADSMANAWEMVAESEHSGKLYMVSQNRRYDPRLHAFRSAITDELGGVGILNSDFYIGAHFGGFRDKMASPLLLDMAIHTFDAARYLSNADALSVYCDESNPSWSWYEGNASAVAIFEMSRGLRYTYRGSWCAEGVHTAWEGEWRAVGPRGTAVWDGVAAPHLEVVERSDGFLSTFTESEAEVREGYPTGIAGSLNDFLNALKTGSIPMGECHDNIKSLAMVFAALESAGTGSRVTLKP